MSDIDLSKLSIDKWWKLLAAVGGAISVAAVAAKFTPAILLGIGLLIFGVGEWINRPIQTQIVPGFQITSHPWNPKAFGLLCDIGGIVLMSLGLYRIIIYAS